MYDAFKSRMKLCGTYDGEARNDHAKKIMDASFTRDPAYKKCWILDKDVIFPEQTLDSYIKAKSVFAGNDIYIPSELKGFHEIDAKYLVHTYYSIQGDAVDYYLQFRPNAHGENSNIRVGTFIFVPDDLGKYNLWLIVAKDDLPQFPKFYILKVNLLLKWYVGLNEIPLFEGKHVDTGTYFSWAAQRTQSSYNSGVWTDYMSTSVENQLKAILPTNNDTRTITYNEHFIISNNPLRRVAWEVSKVEDTTTWGLTKLTFKQELEYDPIDNKSWINLESNQYSSLNTGYDYDFYIPRAHTYQDDEIASMPISYSGASASLKSGGGYKTLTASSFSVESKPSWYIGYSKDNKLICQFKLSYVNDTLQCDENSDMGIIVDGTTIRYVFENEIIFGIKFTYDVLKSNCIKIKCLPIIDMIGNKILVSLGGNLDTSNALQLEVEAI